MALKYGPFNGLENAWDAYDFARYLKLFFGNGVFPNPSNNLQVVAHENMRTRVSVGIGFIEGHKIENDSNFILQHDIADGVLKRIDRVVVRANYLQNKCEIIIKKGTLSSNPVAPTLVRNTDYYELALADVMINNGATVIAQANITDQRLNTSLCGVVATNINQLDTTTLAIQYQNAFQQMTLAQQQEFQQWFADLQTTLDDDVAANLAAAISSLQNGFTQHLDNYVKHPANGGTTAGTATAYTCNSSPNPTTLVDKMGLVITIHVDSGSNPTLKWGSLVAKPIKKPNGSAAILKKDGLYSLRYNLVNDSFILQGEGGEYGTAGVGDVLAGKTIGTEDGIKTGTIVNRGSVSFTPSRSEQNIASGYYLASVVKPIEFAPGANQLHYDGENKLLDSNNPVIKTQLRMNDTGVYRIKFALQANTNSFPVYGQIYKNGIPYGIMRSNDTSTSVSFTEDLRFEKNDTLEIMGWTIFAQYRGYLNAFTISYELIQPSLNKLI